jgi:crotonobetainyl-CoA:carnitine CoA-transferase CaiB-like acyl-CoA transferase
MLLADAGATVIKIERPGTGDPARGLPPFVHANGETVGAGIVRFGRNKRFLSLNLASPEGKKVLLELVAKADALWENFVPGTMDRMGLSDQVMRQVNPGLIHLAISGYGTGAVAPSPYSKRAALDIVAQAASGVMDVSGEPGGPPAQIGAVIGDLVPGLYSVIAMMFALRLRDRTGKGRFIEVGMVDALTALNERAVVANSLTGKFVSRNWLGHAGPYGRFKALDGDIVIGASIPSLWERLAKTIGHPELLAQAPAVDAEGVWYRFGDVMRPYVTEWVAERTAEEVVNEISGAGVPCAQVFGVGEMLASPNTAARRMIVEVSHPAGTANTVGWPMKIEGVPEPEGGRIGKVGSDNNSILGTILGYTDEQIDELKTAGAI